MEMKRWNGERVKEFLWFYFNVPVNNFSIMSVSFMVYEQN